MSRIRILKAWTLGTVVALSGIAAFRVTQPPVIVGPGQFVQIDDVGFAAISVRGESHLGGLYAPPASKFYVLDVRVENNSPTSNITFDPSIIHATMDGKVMSRDPGAEDALSAQEPGGQIQVGESRTDRIVLVGPSNGSQMRISFDYGGQVGTVADALLLGRKQVALTVPRND